MNLNRIMRKLQKAIVSNGFRGPEENDNNVHPVYKSI